jgi:hypothetical protein
MMKARQRQAVFWTLIVIALVCHSIFIEWQFNTAEQPSIIAVRTGTTVSGKYAQEYRGLSPEMLPEHAKIHLYSGMSSRMTPDGWGQRRIVLLGTVAPILLVGAAFLVLNSPKSH